MRRRNKHESENQDRWLVSYSDFITLLFAFFVVGSTRYCPIRSAAPSISHKK